MGESVELPGSFRPPSPHGAGIAAADDLRIRITLHLKHPDELQYAPGSAQDFADLLVPSTRTKLARERAKQFKPARALLADFAKRHNLKLGMMRPMRRTVRVEGTAAQLRDTFGAMFYRTDENRELRRSGTFFLPKEMALWTRAVIGFGRKRTYAAVPGDTARGPGLWPSQISALYGVPADARAAGECIGVIAQGGSYRLSDIAAAARQSGLPIPTVVPGPVAAAFGVDPDADRELTLDLQVLAGVAPGAKLVVYSAPNGIEHLVEALHDALADKINAPHVLSLSWGSSEDDWPQDVRATFDAALRDAIKLRIAVVVATGDYLATGGLMDGKAHVFYPASSPYVLSCGGTTPELEPDSRSIRDEEVWHNVVQGIGTGGGISSNYPVPDYQSKLALPPSVNAGAKPGRGVPDVAAPAWDDPGYAIVFDGQRATEPGTSAATPLWAGILALANARRRAALGFPNYTLYANANLFRQIVKGNNRARGIGYDATPGWNACTGLGAPLGAAVIAALADDTSS
jgi:kumamolisin